MNKDFNTVTEGHDEWLTPPSIIKALGEFDLDPCSPDPAVRPWETAKTHYSKADNGLEKPWEGRVWCNPPYGKETFVWLMKLADHGSGTALIFARTETRGFHREIWDRAKAIFFFQGRLCFYKVTGERGGTANAPSCLVAYSEYDAEKLKESGLVGKFIHL